MIDNDYQRNNKISTLPVNIVTINKIREGTKNQILLDQCIATPSNEI